MQTRASPDTPLATGRLSGKSSPELRETLTRSGEPIGVPSEPRCGHGVRLIHCYEASNFNVVRHVFVQLVSPMELRIQGSPGATYGQQSMWAFTSSAVTVRR